MKIEESNLKGVAVGKTDPSFGCLHRCFKYLLTHTYLQQSYIETKRTIPPNKYFEEWPTGFRTLHISERLIRNVNSTNAFRLTNRRAEKKM